METSSYKVTCFDLKSAGTDPTDANSILSFDDYNRPLVNFFLNLPENEKVILVGYSAGGHSLTDSIHRFGFKKIHTAIYVAATMLKQVNDKLFSCYNFLWFSQTKLFLIYSQHILKKNPYVLSSKVLCSSSN
ncbi:hypothetical protein ACOSQ2_021907 [Xanthoceras sorbifolium]